MTGNGARGSARTEDLVVVREQLNEDNDPVRDSNGQPVVAEHTLARCSVVARLPGTDQATTGEAVTHLLDVRCPDGAADVVATDRVRRTGDPVGRARWRVEGEPARSPFPGGGVVLVLRRQAG